MKKTRGVFEKNPNTGVWWIQYFDSDGSAAGRRSVPRRPPSVRWNHAAPKPAKGSRCPRTFAPWSAWLILRRP